MSPSDHQPLKPPAAPGGTSEKRQSIKKTVDTGPVFAAALERLNRRSMIALIEEVMEQISDHCEKIGISLNNYAEIKNAYTILDQHLQDLHVTNNICITEINNIKQEIISLHAHIPCISVIEKIEELNIKINDMSEKHPPNPPPPQRESKTAWCSSCLCAAAFVLAAAALAWLLHTQYHQNAQQQTLLYQQIADRLTAFESRLKQLEERQANQVTQTALIQQKIDVNAQAIANLDQCRPTPDSVNPPDEPLPPSTVTLATLETNLNLLTALFQKKIMSYEQSIIKLEKCCAAPVPPKPPDPIVPDIIVLSGVNFDTNSSNLTEGAKKILIDVAANLKTAAFSGKHFEVAGHTDDIGDAEKNKVLSQNRADAVRKFLIEKGIRQELLTSKGYGESRPITTDKTEAGRAKNRRVELDDKQ